MDLESTTFPIEGQVENFNFCLVLTIVPFLKQGLANWNRIVHNRDITA